MALVAYQVGDLVHIPQSVDLINCARSDDAQLTIPLAVAQTTEPQVGVVVEAPPLGGYVRIYCDGDEWAVKNSSVYKI